VTIQTPFEPDVYATPESAPLLPDAPGRGARGVWIAVVVGVLAVLAIAAGSAVFLLGGDHQAPVNTHTAVAGEPPLVSVPGYTFADLSGEGATWAYADFEATFSNSNDRASKAFPKLGDFYTGWSVHDVLADDNNLGWLVMAAINPEYVSQGALSDEDIWGAEFINMEAQNLRVQSEVIAGQKVLIGSNDENWAAVWIQDSTEMTVFFDNESQLRDFVATYIAASNG